jgi:hypothetical protein
VYIDGKYLLYFRQTLHQKEGSIDRYLRMESADLLHWSAPVLIKEGTHLKLVCPSVLYKDGYFHLYNVHVDATSGTSKLERCVSSNGFFDGNETVEIHHAPEGKMLWHIDIVDSGEGILNGLFTYSYGMQVIGSTLHYAQSDDGGLTWSVLGKVNIAPESFFKMIYRATMVQKSDKQWNIYYSACSKKDDWHTCIIENFEPEKHLTDRLIEYPV